MYFLLRISPLLSSLAGGGLLYLIIREANSLTDRSSLYSSLGLTGITIAISLLYLITIIFIGAGQPLRTRLRFFPFLFILWVSGIFVFLFQEQAWILWGFIIILPLMTWIWLESLFLYWQQSAQYQAHTLQKVAGYLYLTEIFLFSVALIGAQVLLQIPFWATFLLSAIVYWWLQYDLFRLNQIEAHRSSIYALFGTLLALELVLVLNLLPTHFFMYGLVVSLFFHSWFGIMIQVLHKKKEIKSTAFYLGVSGIGTGIVFFTSLFLR